MTETDDTRPAARKVLILEDNALIASHLARQLASSGFDVVGPATAEAEARALLDAQKPDVAILDFDLGEGGTSEDFATHLSEQDVPFLFLSGRLDRIDRHPSARILGKPHRIGEILSAVEGMLCKR